MYISIHTPTKGATQIAPGVRVNLNISIHTPTKGATVQWHNRHKTLIFQSTLPRRERLIYWYLINAARIFQSTLPRRERQPCIMKGGEQVRYFNPHSHEGSDQKCSKEVPIVKNFNPHSHEGSDISFWTFCIFSEISIHTPTKGATVKFHVVNVNMHNFNPHSHEGSDSFHSWYVNFL